MDWLESVIFGAIPCQVDVRLQGKRRGFDFSSSVYSGVTASILFAPHVEAIINECVRNARDLDYGDFQVTDFFAYIEIKNDGQIMRLMRLEDAGDVIAAKWQTGEPIKIRIQMWSDPTCDDTVVDGDKPSVIRARSRA
eukprot:g5349.t1